MKVVTFDIETYPDLFTIAAVDCYTSEEWSIKITDDINIASKIIAFFKSINADMYVSYNGISFDAPVVKYICEVSPTIKEIHHFSNLCINSMSATELERADLTYYRYRSSKYSPFTKKMHLDLLLVFNKIDRVSLKRLAINLHWHLIQDLPYPPNSYVAHVADEVLKYNLNDARITSAVYAHMYEEIKLRFEVSAEYHVDVLSASRSVMGLKLMEKMYLEMHPDITPWDLRKMRTYRTHLDLSKMIPDNISFQTPKLQQLLTDIKALRFNTSNPEGFGKDDINWNTTVIIGETQYSVGMGGLHSMHKDRPELIYAEKGKIIKDADVASYYPRLMIQQGVFPLHLGKGFLELFVRIVEQRLAAKTAGIVVTADALKIVINAIFGKMGGKHEWLLDVEALYSVTIPGQLYLLVLIERLTLAGIDVFYGNTDGITAILTTEQEVEYMRICNEWEKEFGFDLEFVDIDRMLLRDVNNYTCRLSNGKIKEKGAFVTTPLIHKQIDSLIIPKAIRAWFYDGTPVGDFIKSGKSIGDYVMTVKIGSQFKPIYRTIGNNTSGPFVHDEPVQRVNRYYAGAGSKAGALLKKKTVKGKSTYQTLLSESAVVLINDWNKHDNIPMNYQYYIHRAMKIVDTFLMNKNQTKLSNELF